MNQKDRKGNVVAQTEKKQKSPFKTIVVGVDFSNYSKVVVKQAESLANQLNAKLVVVYATWTEWQVAGPEVFLPTPQPKLKDLEKSVEKFYHLTPSGHVVIEVKRGQITESVLAVANRYQDPLVVVGSQGKSAVSRYILGSNAESIALKSPYPVWVHRGRKVVPLKKVLIPTDLSDSSRKQIDKVRKWSQKLPLSLNYLFVKPEVLPILQYPAYREMADELQKNIKSTLNQFKRRASRVPLVTVSGNNPSEKISRLGKKYDVIAMNPHNRSGLFKDFGRVTSKVIRMADNPVLVMRG